MAEATRLARWVADAAIAEATSMRSQVDSRVVSLAKEVEETTSCAIGAMTHQLEHELEMVAPGTVMTNAQNTHAAIDHLRTEL